MSKGWFPWESSTIYKSDHFPELLEKAKAKTIERKYVVLFMLDKMSGCFAARIVKQDGTIVEQLFLLTHDRREDILLWLSLDHEDDVLPPLETDYYSD